MELIKILFILLTLHSLFFYFRRRKQSNILCCGLFCYVGNRAPDANKLRILALYNITRGDHATGVCVDNDILKDTIDAREYLVKHGDIFEMVKGAKATHSFLGHCRSATAHYNKDNMTYAHPHSYKKDNEDFLRLVHNGTVLNCYDLSQKYDTTQTNKSDSMIIAELITKDWGNFNILKEYEGSATIAFYNVNEKNTLYVHRDTLRELYYWHDTKNKCYISSIKNSLVAIGATVETVQEFTPGKLYKFVDGLIVDVLDFTTKIPYSIPVVKKHQSAYQPSYVKIKAKSSLHVSENGFYWKNFLLHFNGHAYTGKFYATNTVPERLEKKMPNPGQESSTQYWAVMGLVMKDQENYEKLYNSCISKTYFDYEKYKLLLSCQLKNYSLYPVLGKAYIKEKIFWSDELSKIGDDDVTATYSWRPVGSDTIYKINRPGLLISEESIEPSLTNVQIISRLIDGKLANNESYSEIDTLFKAFREEIKKPSFNFDIFADDLINVMAESGLVEKPVLDHLDRLRTTEDTNYAWNSEFSFGFLLTLKDVFNTFQRTRFAQLHVADDETEELVDVETDLSSTEMSNYYQTDRWKDEVLFGDYEGLDDVITAFLPSDSPENKKELFKGIARLLVEVGHITTDDHRNICNKKDIESMYLELKREFDSLIENNVFKKIHQIFALDSDQLTDEFARLYFDKLELAQKTSKTYKENLKSNILDLGLKYIVNKSHTLDKMALADKHGISLEVLKKIECT